MYSLENSITLAKNYLGDKYFADLTISYTKVEDRTVLEINKTGSNIEIKYGELSSLYFALTLIKQNHKKDEYHISLNRHFKSNGLMHDCSRNGVLNINQAKEMIMVSALFGLNQFMLYTEDTYEIEDEPFFGYMRGRYTKEELKDLVAYSNSFGVELIPCIQTLSHLAAALKWPAFSNIADTGNTLLAGHEPTYVFIEKMIKTCREVFDSKNIHIGLDEAIDLASGQFIWKDKVLDKKELFLNHLNRVVEICKKYNFKPQMWCDMFFKLEADNSEGHKNWYEFQGNLSEKVESLIPDVGFIYWDYYHDQSEVYDRMFKISKHTKKEGIFADGAISWIGFAPNITQSLKITRVGLKSAVKNKVDSLLITSWGDGGNECSVITSYPCMALHALYDFYGGGSDAKLSKLLETVTGDPLKRWALLQEVNHLRPNVEQAPYENLSKPMVYQDILMGAADSLVKPFFSEAYKKVAKELSSAAKKSKKYGYQYKSLAALADLLIEKSTIGIRLRDTYKTKEKEELKPFIAELKLIDKKVDKFVETYREQWMRQNKTFGFEIIDGRFGWLKARIKSTIIVLNDYLSGKTNSIPELELEILTWQGTKLFEDGILIGYWPEVASQNVI